MDTGLGYISVHTISQSRLGGVAAYHANWVMVSIKSCCVEVVNPYSPFQEATTIS